MEELQERQKANVNASAAQKTQISGALDQSEIPKATHCNGHNAFITG
jgi:hypothetical protein